MHALIVLQRNERRFECRLGRHPLLQGDISHADQVQHRRADVVAGIRRRASSAIFPVQHFGDEAGRIAGLEHGQRGAEVSLARANAPS